MNKTVILTIAVLTGLLVLGFNFEEVFSAEPAPSGPVPIPYPVTTKEPEQTQKDLDALAEDIDEIIKESKLFPAWFKQNMKWHLEGQLSEQELANGFEYLINKNIIFLNPERAQEVADLRAQVAEQQAAIGALKTMGSAQTLATTPTVDDITTEGDSGGTTSGSAYEGISDAMLPSATSPQLNVAAVDVPTESGTQRVLVVGGENTDINALVQWVIRESYMEQTEDLSYYAEKVRYYNDMKEAVHDIIIEDRFFQTTNPDILNPDVMKEVESIQDVLDDPNTGQIAVEKLQIQLASADADVLDVSNELQANLDAKASLREQIAELRDQITVQSSDPTSSAGYYAGSTTTTTDTLESELEQLEAKLAKYDETTQMMQLELQDAMNKQQQVMQTLSAIMKSQHDTLKAIISNMRA